MSENQVITPEQLEEYMQGLYAKSKVAQKKFETRVYHQPPCGRSASRHRYEDLRICRGTLH